MSIPNPSYYPHDFADEVMPRDLKDSSLASWAAWLAQGGDQPDEDDDPKEPSGWRVKVPDDGAQFKTTETTWLDDVTARMSADGEITFNPPLPADADFLAFRFGPDLGWSPEDIICDTDDPAAYIKECEMLSPGDDGLLAVGRSRQIVCVYRSDPPRLEIAGAVQ